MTGASRGSRGLVALIYLGLLGTAFALATIFSTLPANAEGTCGPSKASETAAEALFEPGSIGAGTKPAATDAAALKGWNDFVNACQSATDVRAWVAFPVGAVSLGLIIVPLVVLGRRRRSRGGAAAADEPSAFGGPGYGGPGYGGPGYGGPGYGGPGYGGPPPDDRPLVGAGAATPPPAAGTGWGHADPPGGATAPPPPAPPSAQPRPLWPPAPSPQPPSATPPSPPSWTPTQPSPPGGD